MLWKGSFWEWGRRRIAASRYARATRARDWIGRYAFWGYVVLLLIFYFGDRFSGPPESMRQIAWTGVVATVVMLVWAMGIGRRRGS
jgi:hypothetical protein